MTTARDAVIGTLIAVKLEARRLLRRWRVRGRVRVIPSPAGILDETGTPDAVSRKPRGARLPARCPDGAPLGVPLALFVLAFAVRTWHIDEPASVVFDELHFGKFVKAYWAGKFYFDIHPPLGKLNLYAVSRLFANQPPSSNFSRIGDPYDRVTDAAYIPMRVSSAVFGSTVPPLTYLIAREVGLSFPASVLPAIAQTFDSLVIVEGRLILMDAQLVCFMACCLLCALRLWGSSRRTRRRALYLVLTAVFGALSLSVKWTSLATPALVALISLSGAIFPAQGALDLLEMALAGIIALGLYMVLFYIHFALLPLSGGGDRFMFRSFQATLVGNEKFHKGAPRPWFFSSFVYLNRRMLSASAGIKTRHRWESKWYQWIVSHRGVLYHVKVGESGLVSKIYLVANLAVVYSVLGAVVGFALYGALFRLWRHRCTLRMGPPAMETASLKRGAFFLLGYVWNLLPYMLVSRCTFLYHYVPALFYGELLLGNCVNMLPVYWQRRVVAWLSLLIILAFVYWSPWIYGSPLSGAQHDMRAVYGESWH